MLPLVDEETCAQALTRLKNNVAQFNLNAARPISLAAGFSTARAGDDIEALIAKADRRMYQEKARMKAVAGNEKHIP
jgi:GGDEF domain-containing protein